MKPVLERLLCRKYVARGQGTEGLADLRASTFSDGGEARGTGIPGGFFSESSAD